MWMKVPICRVVPRLRFDCSKSLKTAKDSGFETGSRLAIQLSMTLNYLEVNGFLQVLRIARQLTID